MRQHHVKKSCPCKGVVFGYRKATNRRGNHSRLVAFYYLVEVILCVIIMKQYEQVSPIPLVYVLVAWGYAIINEENQKRRSSRFPSNRQ